MSTNVLPETQSALLVHGPRQKYQLSSIPLPNFQSEDEVLVRIDAIGLNPVDWKSVAYNFALPVLPALNGRDLAGTVVRIGSQVERFRVGDRVFAVSTNYRDYRTSSFQQYAVASSHCLGLVPPNVTTEESAALGSSFFTSSSILSRVDLFLLADQSGVGVSTAAIALSSTLGIRIRDFASFELGIGSEGELDRSTLPPPIEQGEWLLIWGASCVTGFFAAQFARLAGLKVIAVVCEKKHGDRLRKIGVEHVVDRHDPISAISQIRSITSDKLKFAIDCVGSETAGFAQRGLRSEGESWLVGLSGLPKELREGVNGRSVPIKTVHTNNRIGSGLMKLIEELLASNELVLPDITVLEGGLEVVNDGLEKLRTGAVSFGRIVVKAN
ncbi:hypothetical protein JCM5350_004307 [Sporobolomyces pararoseus]